MKKITLNLTLALLFSYLVAGCSTMNDGTTKTVQKKQSPYAQQMAVIMEAANSREMFFMEVPSPNNLISEKLMLASLSMGDSSTAIDQLVHLLSSGKTLSVGIVGKSQAINVMTVKRALEKTNGKQASGSVFLVADDTYQQSLMATNTNPDVKLVFVDKALPQIPVSTQEAADMQSHTSNSFTSVSEYPDQTTRLQQNVQSQNNRQMKNLLRNTAPKTR